VFHSNFVVAVVGVIRNGIRPISSVTITKMDRIAFFDLFNSLSPKFFPILLMFVGVSLNLKFTE